MARFEFKLPDIGEGIAEAEIVSWHVAVGDAIDEDQPIADMMTDKATVEMESPVSGKVIELAGEVGDMVAIGAVLVAIETDAAAAASADAVQQDAAPGRADEDAAPAAPETVPETAPAPDGEAAALKKAEEPAPAAPPAAGDQPAAQILASPAVRARARDMGIDLAQVRSLGGDRIRHSDLDAFLTYGGGGRAASPASVQREDETVKVVGLRRKIAENMQEAKRRIPHFTYVEEMDVTALEALRATMNAGRGDKPKLTLLPFLTTVMCRALPDFPMLNARYDDEVNVITRSGAVHMGMATQTDGGLSVAVIRDAQSRDLWNLAAEILRLADAARTGKASRAELSGSTITLSSLGPMGGVVSTPVINRPEVAIIAVNKVLERPVVVDGRIEVRKMMNLSISCDHRVVDGWDAASFMQAVKRLVENPALLFAA